MSAREAVSGDQVGANQVPSQAAHATGEDLYRSESIPGPTPAPANLGR